MEIGVAMFEPRVLSSRNIVNVLIQSSYLVVFASAQMIVILTRGFDLSLGASVSAISVVTALVTTSLNADGAPAWLIVSAGLAAGLGSGLLVGLFNGFSSSPGSASIPRRDAGSLNICLGSPRRIRRSAGFHVPDPFSSFLYDGKLISGVPACHLAILVCLGLHLLLEHTVFGRRSISSAARRVLRISPGSRAAAISPRLCRVGCSPVSAR